MDLEYTLSELTKQQYTALAVAAAESLKWKIFDISRVGFKADTNKGIWSANQLIKFKIIDDVIHIESSSIENEMVDFGKNKRNVKRLTTAIK